MYVFRYNLKCNNYHINKIIDMGKNPWYFVVMDIKEKDIEKNIKIMAAASGVSLAEMARRAGDTPQGLNQRLRTGKIQKVLDYLSSLAEVVGFDFEYRFIEK